MKKFEKVNAALLNATRDTNNFVTLCRGPRDARDNNSIKFHTRNVITNSTQESFKTLNQVITSFNLTI